TKSTDGHAPFELTSHVKEDHNTGAGFGLLPRRRLQKSDIKKATVRWKGEEKGQRWRCCCGIPTMSSILTHSRCPPENDTREQVEEASPSSPLPPRSIRVTKKRRTKMALLPLFDPLYCQEESLELEEGRTGPLSPDRLLEDWAAVAEEEWVEALCSLAAREGQTRLPDGGREHTYLLSARREAVEWVARAAERHLFSALTALLAVDYLDRCFLTSSAAGGLRLQQDKPWMGRLATVACLSLAAKVEETRVPLLLDLQLSLAAKTATEPEDNKFVFEAKTIRLMELLVLSSLGWRMNPVTPLSFIHHLLPRLCPCSKDKNAIGTARVRDLVNGCEAILLCVIAGECSAKRLLLLLLLKHLFVFGNLT
ncbi:hypothetical protein BHE74_00049975, partial [Ensete ventricosum]